MKFRTELNITSENLGLNHHHKMMFVGSCFSENISHHLRRLHFQVNTGAHGILFHPIAIFNALQDIVYSRVYGLKDLTKAPHGWVSLSHHGAFAHEDAESLLMKIQEVMTESHLFLKEASLLSITFGTAMGYRNFASNRIVANCHRLPQQDFERELSSMNDLYESARKAIKSVYDFNPDLKIILTVSPVRHLREGFIENQRSKSRLILLCEQLEREFEGIRYFPAYELVMDELRDYRFYEEDMIHPSKAAVGFVAEKFERFVLTEQARSACASILPFVLKKEHRSIHEGIEEAEKRKAESDNQIRLTLEKSYKF
jgi:hypothetical protein